MVRGYRVLRDLTHPGGCRMNFDALATLHRGYAPSSGGIRSENAENGRLGPLVRKVMAMPPIERQQFSIVVGDFVYRRAEIEALSKHPDFSETAMDQAHAAVSRYRSA